MQNVHYLSLHQIDLNQAVDSGSIAWTGAGTWTPESQDSICVDFYGDDNQNYCCQLGQALTSADGLNLSQISIQCNQYFLYHYRMIWK